MTVLGTTVGAEAAKDELLGILEAIAVQRGLSTALGAAGALQRAIAEGRINGHCYLMLSRPDCGCVIGHLAMALGWTGGQGLPEVPGWQVKALSATPIERWVENVTPGETVHSRTALSVLDAWVTAWMAEHRALPGDAV